MPSSSTPVWVPIAELLRPQGRRGELLADPLSTLDGIFSTGKQLWVVPAGASAPLDGAAPILLEEHWFPTGRNAGRVVLKLAGCDSITAAEALAGRLALMPAEELPKLEEDTYFIGDLVGCALFDSERLVGQVVDVQFATSPDGRSRIPDAAPLLEVATGIEDETLLIPFVKAWIDGVDIAVKRIVMRLPEGLSEPSDAIPEAS